MLLPACSKWLLVIMVHDSPVLGRSMRYALIPAGAGGHSSRPHLIVSAVRFSIGEKWLVFRMQTCRMTRSVWVRGGLLIGVSSSWCKAFPLRNWLSQSARLLFHALTVLSSCL